LLDQPEEAPSGIEAPRLDAEDKLDLFRGFSKERAGRRHRFIDAQARVPQRYPT